ncbi:MAG: hypothetical protein AAGA90_04525 [Actinomycetota bacterium]
MRVRRNAGSSTMRLIAALSIAALVAAGCGGGDDDAPESGSDAPTTDGGDDTAATDDGGDGTGDGTADDGGSTDDSDGDDDTSAPAVEGVAAGTATVTIGDVTYVADQQAVCVQIGEAIGGSWSNGEDISISIDLPPQDWETSSDGWTAPTVRVDDDSDATTPKQFQANPEMASMLSIDEDASTVTSWAVDGASASGTGVFVEFFGSMAAISLGEDAPAPVEGTFSLTCE